MHYKQRWYYVALLCVSIFGVGFLYIIKPDVERLKTLHQKENSLQQQWVELKKSTPERLDHDAVSVTDFDYFKNILMMAYRKRVVIQAIHFKYAEQIDSAQMTKMHLLIHGSYQAIFSFLAELLQPASGAVILNFKSKILNSTQLAMAMDMLVLKNKLKMGQMNTFKFRNSKNPFCFCASDHHFEFYNNTDDLALIPSSQMKMIGYVHQRKYSEGFILLPNSAVVTVKINDVIGKERGVVTGIEPNRMLIRLPSGNFLTIVGRKASPPHG